MAKQENEIPESFFCPLTHEIMVDPVVDPEGNSYERSAIEVWLSKEKTSPITRSPLQISSLVPNRALRDAIDGLKDATKKATEKGPISSIEPAEPAQSIPAQSPVAQSTVPAPTQSAEPAISPPITPSNKKQDENVGPETVQVKVLASKQESTEDYDVLISLHPPEGSARTPVDICCVLDISGSMGTEAQVKTAGGELESHGLSLLDIVKHAVKTISHSLQVQDRLALVVYSTKARTEMELTFMDDSAKVTVDHKLDKLCPEDSTNIWDGLETGLNVLRKGSKPGRQAALFLLTDGWPNVCPPRGEVGMFKRYKDQHQVPCLVSTFGFGYKLNSELLNELAIEGNGMFSFIPDSGFVGTAFVNAASNLLVTMGSNVALSLEPQNGASIVSVMGNLKSTVSSWGTLVNLPSLQYGQNLDVVVKMKIPSSLAKDQSYLTATLNFDHWNFTQPAKCSVDATDREGSAEVKVQSRRLRVVESIKKIMLAKNSHDTFGVQTIITDLENDLKLGTDPREQGLHADISGQVREAATNPKYFQKWGVHYLPSLCRAHQLQQSNNFKDVGIQFYGGHLFQQVRDVIDDIFLKLPPPKKSITSSSSAAKNPPSKKSSSSVSSSSSYSAPSFNMSAYYTSQGPCFAGKSSVLMADGSHKFVENVAKGDSVATLNHQQAEVLCVLKTHCRGNQTMLVEIDGLHVTPYHPIKISGKWCFPCDVRQASLQQCPAVYSFVLRENSTDHVMIINGIECVTLGHNYVDDDVVRHPYFGSHKVVDDLRNMHGWNRGIVEVYSGCLIRDDRTGLVCGIHGDYVIEKTTAVAVESSSVSLVCDA